MKVIAIDPGETNGIVIAEVDHLLHEVNIHQTYETSWDDWNSLCGLLCGPGYSEAVVVIEDFRLAAGRAIHLVTSQLLTIRVIGAVQYIVATDNKAPNILVFSQPGAMQLYSDERLKKLGWYHKSKHVRAAMKHLLAYWFKGKDCTFSCQS